MEFIKAFNERTADLRGYVVPAEITVYEDRSLHVRHEGARWRPRC